MRRKVLHVITATGVGGAENMLYKYLCNSNKNYLDHSVVSLTGIDEFGLKIKALQIPVYALSKPIYTLQGMRELYILAKQLRPDLLQSWLYHSDLVALILSFLLKSKLCWNIRSYKVFKYSILTAMLVRVLALFSRVPDAVIINSIASMNYHHKICYRPNRWEYVPNGFDPNIFKRKSELKNDIRTELDIASHSNIVGMVARYSIEKDHESFLRACSLIHKVLPSVQFVMMGNGVDQLNLRLTHIIDELDLHDCVHLLGVRLDVPAIVPYFDIACSSSIDEAFPNVIGEAMTAGVPCVVTDVGDCAMVVGDTGRVVPLGDPKYISDACLELLSLPETERRDLGYQARIRAIKEFSIQKISAKYDDIYLSI